MHAHLQPTYLARYRPKNELLTGAGPLGSCFSPGARQNRTPTPAPPTKGSGLRGAAGLHWCAWPPSRRSDSGMGRGCAACLFAPPRPALHRPHHPRGQKRLLQPRDRPAARAALISSVSLRLLCPTAAVSTPTCAWPPLQTRRTPPHWQSRSCWAASSAAGAAARTRYPGEGPGGQAGGHPDELTGAAW